MLRSVVKTRRSESTEKKADSADELVISGEGSEAPGLPEEIVIIDEGDKITPDFAPVQRPIALSLQAVEQSLRRLISQEHIAERSVVAVPIHAFRKTEIQH